ncbi:chemotaxis protein CheB [Spirosoma utsteinense]|uniref:protein-glutamate methylesterase n=1 Tax=Spirosoma utsteinense TaxID=2585773 RepID=A0ABR6W6V3_9BACT|nr:chemotaxis protein CheB [Spirosoma utsteinense]MBC3787527.1 two-component system chemotaxis response regulator CheB [Spirosoma utsteinense]MBC3792212.1 two-component system chemotaxis response regulator CheB [Spirosoma utsteinense]
MAESGVIVPNKVVIIGGSTGSIEVLLQLLPALQSPLAFSVVIVLHRKNTADSTLANLLSLKTAIPVKEVDDKDILQPGHIYLAPADYHLLIELDGSFSLDDSEKVNYSRPSIDVAFESAADVFGPALIGVLLSGANADGTNGLIAIKQAGGQVVVQQPETAQVAFMPQQAILRSQPDYILDVPGLIALLTTGI